MITNRYKMCASSAWVHTTKNFRMRELAFKGAQDFFNYTRKERTCMLDNKLQMEIVVCSKICGR